MMLTWGSVAHFNCLDLRNVMAPFMMPSLSWDTDTGINGVT